MAVDDVVCREIAEQTWPSTNPTIRALWDRRWTLNPALLGAFHGPGEDQDQFMDVLEEREVGMSVMRVNRRSAEILKWIMG